MEKAVKYVIIVLVVFILIMMFTSKCDKGKINAQEHEAPPPAAALK